MTANMSIPIAYLYDNHWYSWTHPRPSSPASVEAIKFDNGMILDLVRGWIPGNVHYPAINLETRLHAIEKRLEAIERALPAQAISPLPPSAPASYFAEGTIREGQPTHHKFKAVNGQWVPL